MRYTRESYNFILANDYYKQLMECQEPTIYTNDACFCPSGQTGWNCKRREFHQCYVNITEPALHKGCPKPDSPDYVFSTPGFDPCHFFDFESGQTEIKYLLNCKAVDKQGFVLADGHKEGLGFEYLDLVEQPTANPFPYIKN